MNRSFRPPSIRRWLIPLPNIINSSNGEWISASSLIPPAKVQQAIEIIELILAVPDSENGNLISTKRLVRMAFLL